MVYENKWLGTGTVGNDANTATLINAPGPGSFTSTSVPAGKWGTTPDGYNALKISVTAAGKARLDNTLSTANQSRQFSFTEDFALSALPPSGSANNIQIVSVQATTGSAQYSLAAINVTSSGAVGLAVSNGTTPSYPNTGLTIVAGKTYRFNLWGDMSSDATTGKVSIAIYDVAAGTQVGSTYTYTGDLGGANSGGTIVAFFAGKCDTGNQSGIDLYFTSMIEATGVAKDYGVSPDMSAPKNPTAPTVSKFPNIDAEPGQRIAVHGRVTPTTSGATATNISISLVSIVDYTTGSAVTPTNANTPAWRDPANLTVSGCGLSFAVDKNFVRETTMPYVTTPLKYTFKITGTDSTGLSDSKQFTIDLWSNDVMWGSQHAPIYGR